MNPSPSPARASNQMRPISIEPFDTAAAGSVLCKFGGTAVLCTASVADRPPPWIRTDDNGRPVHGWVSAEYNMLPGSTPDRKKRRADGRSTEIQRLIGRSLRAAVDLDAMPGVSITCDCDVVRADGGTRTASITGAAVALAQALYGEQAAGRLSPDAAPLAHLVSAVSVGIVDGQPVLDLDYPLDSRAEVDLNVVLLSDGRLVEVQGAAEREAFSRDELTAMLDLAESARAPLSSAQQQALRALGVAWPGEARGG
ncbi:MAG: ribonuclease PH [Planctomycetota bacterium]